MIQPRTLLTAGAFLFLSGIQTWAQGPVSRDENTDRPGNDYRNFELSRPDAGLCGEECARDARCKAYVYVAPGVQGQSARCWLKDSVPESRRDTCCVSGVKGAKGLLKASAAEDISKELNVDRAGNDYRNFDMPQADPELCRRECRLDERCRSYTYVKPGVQGSPARCWLKENVPAARNDNCCVSGVKTR
jgi:hypothetical protein